MTTQQPRSFATLAAAIIVAGLLVSGTLYFTVGQPPKTVTSIGTSTSTTTETSTMISTISNTASFQTSTTTQTVTTTATLTAKQHLYRIFDLQRLGRRPGLLHTGAIGLDGPAHLGPHRPGDPDRQLWLDDLLLPVHDQRDRLDSNFERGQRGQVLPVCHVRWAERHILHSHPAGAARVCDSVSPVRQLHGDHEAAYHHFNGHITCHLSLRYRVCIVRLRSNGPVQVLSVQATQFVCQNCGAVNGQSYLTFQVALENVGNSSIYIAGGTGELSVSIPANSSVVHTVPTEECAGTFTIIELGQGQNYTLGGPPCDDGLDYQVVQAGTVNIAFRFDWTTNPAANTFPDSTAISAEFTFA